MEDGNTVVGGAGMADIISQLKTELTADKLWGAVTPVAGILGVLILFSIGVYFLRKALRGASKGKARV